MSIRKIIGAILLALASLIGGTSLSGCGDVETDVTADTRYNFQSFAGSTYKAKDKLTVVKVKQYNGQQNMILFPASTFDRSRSDYRTLPGVLGTVTDVSVGAKVQVSRLMKDNGNWGGVRVTALLEDGTVVYLSERLLVPNKFISVGESQTAAWDLNPESFEKER